MRTVTSLVLTVFLALPAVSHAAPQRVIVMPVEFKVLELSAGGVLDVLPEETETAKSIYAEAVAKRFEDSRTYSVVAMPELSDDEAELLQAHVALYGLVSQEAVARSVGGGWGHKKKAFDYTVGPGLRFLAERTGADKAIFTGGHAMQATGGRVLLAIAAAAGGFAVPTGDSNVSLAIVNLHTGNIEWLNATQYYSARSVLGEPGTILARLFQGFPSSKYHARIL